MHLKTRGGKAFRNRFILTTPPPKKNPLVNVRLTSVHGLHHPVRAVVPRGHPGRQLPQLHVQQPRVLQGNCDTRRGGGVTGCREGRGGEGRPVTSPRPPHSPGLSTILPLPEVPRARGLTGGSSLHPEARGRGDWRHRRTGAPPPQGFAPLELVRHHSARRCGEMTLSGVV